MYSGFPDSWPGAGLLLLRLAVGLPLVVNSVPAWAADAATGGVIGHLASVCCGVLLLAGLWTPVVSVAWAFAVVALSVSKPFNLLQLAPALVPLSLAVLGPGAWSIDARVYGRKRIRV
jgi:putative oxidoreductase